MRKFFYKAIVVTCVFIAAFMLTVIAFADFEVENPEHKGTYYSDRSGGSIIISDSAIKILSYYDSNELCFLSGTSTDGKLSNSSVNFYAIVNKAYKVYSNGSYVDKYPYISYYRATGNVTFKWGGLFNSHIKQITITSNESGYKYILNR